MKIVIVSDTHGNWPVAAEAIRAEGSIDYLIFLGDYASDGRQLETVTPFPMNWRNS